LLQKADKKRNNLNPIKLPLASRHFLTTDQCVTHACTLLVFNAKEGAIAQIEKCAALLKLSRANNLNMAHGMRYHR
jgi:hypothetical protein